jgi:hypothetical protein
MANALDLLSPTVRDVRQEQIDEENRLQRLATMTPDQRNAYLAASGGRGMGKALGQAAGGLFGVDTRSDTEKYTDAVAKVKAQVQQEGVSPTDLDKFYPRVIQLLGQNGLLSEAAAMNREYQKLRAETRRTDIALAREERLARNDAARVEVARQNAETARQKLGASAPEVIRLLDAADQPGISDERRKAIIARVNQLSLGKVEWRDAGDRIVPVQGGQTLGAGVEKGESPDAKLRAATAKEIAQFKADSKALGVQDDTALKGPELRKIAGQHAVMAAVKHAYDELTAYPKAVGWQNYGDVLGRVNRMDPKGAAARAAVADIASQLLHERSGAAISEGEFQRLNPFVPQATDEFDPAVTKLRQLYRTATEIANATRTTAGVPYVNYPDLPTFTPQQPTGPKEQTPAKQPRLVPQKSAAPAAEPAKPAAKADEWVEMTKPDGKRVEVHAEDVAEAEANGYKRVH